MWGSPASHSDPEQGRDSPLGHSGLCICSAPDTLCDLVDFCSLWALISSHKEGLVEVVCVELASLGKLS